jgi:hypothetical protein
MDSRRINAVAAVVTLLAMAGRWGPGWLLDQQVVRWTGATDPGFLPRIGTVGQTVLTYSYAVRAIALLLPLAVGVGLGVWLARRVGDDELGAGLRAVAVGGTAVVTLPVLSAIVVWGGLDPTGLVMALAMAVNFVVAGPVYVTVAAAAGVMLETLGLFEDSLGERKTGQPVDDDATPEREAAS